MIYVTVGTHEQPFDRLIKYVDELKGDGTIEDEVVIQSGYSTCHVRNCRTEKMFEPSEMMGYFNDARIIITHGGPSSIIRCLELGKIPIVVPRQKKYGEHINDHQLDFCRAMAGRYDNIIVAEEMADLKDAILKYDSLAASKKPHGFGNNKNFVEGLERIVGEL